MIEIPKTIQKSEIALLGELKGKTNAGPVKIRDVEYAVGELCFLGFAGAVTEDLSIYAGVLRFEPKVGLDHAARCMFDFLDGPATTPRARKTTNKK